jgi:hypothetical protein
VHLSSFQNKFLLRHVKSEMVSPETADLPNFPILMRRVSQEDQIEPLSFKEVKQFREEHLPYRLALIRDAVSRVPVQSLADDQAFEAAAVAGRVLLGFLGVGYDSKKKLLQEDRRYRTQDGFTDDVKIIDVGGRYVDIARLSQEENALLMRFIHGVHKACAHLTAAKHGLDVPTFQSTAVLIQRLYEEHINTV